MADDNVDYKKIAKQLDDFLTEKNPKYLLFGENHQDISANAALIRHPEILSVFQKHGFYDIAIEGRIEFAKDISNVSDGTLRPLDFAQKVVDEFKKSGDTLAGSGFAPNYNKALVAEQSGRLGFITHYVEGQYPSLNEHVVNYLIPFDEASRDLTIARKEKKSLWENVDDVFDSLTYFFREASVDREVAVEIAKFKMKSPEGHRIEQLLDGRREYDPKLADKIKDVTEGRKAVIWYGLAHGWGDHDLDEALGKDETARIILCPDTSGYRKTSQSHYTEERQVPAAYLDIKGGRLVSGDQAYKEAEKAYPNEQTAKPAPQVSVP